MKRKIRLHGKDLTLPLNLHRQLETVLDSFSLRTDIHRLSVNFRDTGYYHRREGLHPVEMRFERDEDNRHIWKLVFIASFSYPDEHSPHVAPELYFNFKRGWFYQPDIQGCELARPQVIDLFKSWAIAFARQLHNQHFDDISANELRL
ncbi:DUF2787 domain-containing protein [Vibrio scophthalmi]|uniref:DUF2787 domain-containing protein n=1 Tax=Vibrio scophthalmi LMG 19158 TaxID=870967 RepID=F9RNQ9_9VIBR|nr:DUF2787 domain-containing protein [Vibrio scophthalmi]EGU36855.1 hypothetical protein VIS19158_13927 [Vibrio scophthalmi LMG 19158]